MIPAELLDRTWQYLLGESSAATRSRRDPGGHGISARNLTELGSWIDELAAGAARTVDRDAPEAPARA